MLSSRYLALLSISFISAFSPPLLPSASATTITDVVFNGNAATPTITIYGTGFNPQPAPTSLGFPGFTGFDYGIELYFRDNSNNPNIFEAGHDDDPTHVVRSYIGLVILSYSDSQMSYQFGSDYALFYYPSNIYQLNQGDSFAAFVHGTSFSGTVNYVPEPTPALLGIIGALFIFAAIRSVSKYVD